MNGGHFFKQTIRDVPLEGKTVLLRADYNVPLEEDGSIADDFRIRSSLPTIEYLLEARCKVVIISHLGRPEGKREQKFSLAPVAERLSQLVDAPVRFVDDCIGDKARMAVKKAPAVSVVLLENLRFYAEEEANNQAFAKQLAKSSNARYFVEDGFGVVHRAHASTAAITMELPSVAGLLLEKEYRTITGAMRQPDRPLVAVLGGAKVSDKIELVEALEPIADKLLIGGAMANTFLAARGTAIGTSKHEADQDAEVAKIYDVARKKAGETGVDDFIELPTDVVVASSPDDEQVRTVPIGAIAENDMALDIGPQTIDSYTSIIANAATVIWNGTLGYAEKDQFAHGSARVALELATHPDITSIIGGGDTADFVLHWDSRSGDSFTHVSTGGGASLELMAGKKLPGVESLLDAR